jgi:uncharacterized protein YbaA (DUF1428 family)
MENEIGNIIRLFVWLIPKTNHEALMQLAKPVRELFKNVGVNQEIFQLKVGPDLHEQDKMAEQMGFTNIAKTIAAKEDEEVWLELQFYRDQKHLDDLGAKMQKDENAGKLGKQFMDLLTPGSCIEGWFSHVNI